METVAQIKAKQIKGFFSDKQELFNTRDDTRETQGSTGNSQSSRLQIIESRQ